MSKTNIIYIIACAIAAHCAATAWGQTVPTYTITTIAGNGTPGFTGDSGAATSAELFLPYAAVFVNGNLYISDQVNSRVRVVSNGTITTIAGNGTQGYSGDNSAATKAELFFTTGLTVDGSGNVYVSDIRNQVIRKITTSGTISTYAGNNAEGAGLSGDSGTATNAQLFNPAGLALDSKGNLYIADEGNAKIRIVFNTGSNAGSINTFAGNLTADYAGDDGPAINAELNQPRGVAVDSQGNVYIADTDNNRIREVTATDGIMHTVAGTGVAGHLGDGGQALNAQLNHPQGIAVDSKGNLYIADSFNQRIRMVQTNGVIVTIAGTGTDGYTGDNGLGTQAELSFPVGVSVDTNGNVYVSDSQNNVIRKLTPVTAPTSSVTSAIFPNGVITATEFGGFDTAVAPGSWVEIHGTNLAPTTTEWTANVFSAKTVPLQLDQTTVQIANIPAYVSYVSPGVVKALLPSNVPLGTQTITVSNLDGTSASAVVNVQPTMPGLYAPGLALRGNPYVSAMFTDMSTYVGPPDAFAGLTSERANPGDTIVLFGSGFGPVTPNVVAGTASAKDAALITPVQFFFNGTPATVTYAGIAPGSVGVYRFEVMVPNLPSSDLVKLTFTLGGVEGAQTLYTSVQNAWSRPATGTIARH